MSWSHDELIKINLCDERLNKRAKKVLSDLCARPGDSIPAASKDWYATKAAYNFLSHEKVISKDILMPHIDSLIARTTDEPVLLCPQDTTELDYTGQKGNKAHGFLNTEHRHGSYLHVSMVTTPSRLPLGILSMEVVKRDQLQNQMSKEERKAHKTKPIQEKESYRWVSAYQDACALAQQVPDKQVVSISDRECDFYEFMELAQGNVDSGQAYADWLIRGKWDRLIEGKDGQKIKVRQSLEKLDPIAEIEYVLPERNQQKSRKVKQLVYTSLVSVLAPKADENGEKKSIQITAILLKEIDTPEGEEPLTRLLFSSVIADTPERTLEIVNWYVCRWDIEMLFKVFKSGCNIEKLQLESDHSLENAFMLYLIISWRIMYLTLLGRECPELSCDVVFTDYEWKAVYIAVKKMPKTPPNLGEMIKMIASLGGHLNRKSDNPPGIKVMWIGLQRMHDMALILELSQKGTQGDLSYG